MSDENPFEDVEKAIDALLKKQLELVKEIDEMDVDVTPWEADFLENVLRQLQKEKRPLTQGQLDIVHRLCETYDIDYQDF